MRAILYTLWAAAIICKVLEIHPVGDWSWWLVMAPLWVILGGLTVVGAILILAAKRGKTLGGMQAKILDKWDETRSKKH